MTTTDDVIAERLDNGETPWPRAGGIRDISLREDEFVELVSGRRTCWPVHDDLDLCIGDLLVFYPHRERWPITGVSPAIRQVTHLWTHDGIAPGWAIASLRPVQLNGEA